MRGADRSILIGLVIVGLLACFWFMLLSPKRQRASELETKVAELQSEVSAQEQLAVAAEQAQADYEKNYERLVVLGKAAPPDGDTPSLLTQLTTLAERSRTDFGALTLGEAGEVAAPAPAETTTDQNAEAGAPTSGASTEPAAAEPGATPTATPAPATEAAAATLPIGAIVGPAGLGVLPYNLNFRGDFFQVAELLGRFDALVASRKAGMAVDGRLMTVNGFTLTPGDGKALDVELAVTTYVLPESQGLTAGATPAAPASTVPAATPTAPAP